MKIKKGDKFVCIKKVKMQPSKEIKYKKGYIYFSEVSGCITNNCGNREHQWTGKYIKKHFIKIKTE
jgi:hypothetical protein